MRLCCLQTVEIWTTEIWIHDALGTEDVARLVSPHCAAENGKENAFSFESGREARTHLPIPYEINIKGYSWMETSADKFYGSSWDTNDIEDPLATRQGREVNCMKSTSRRFGPEADDDDRLPEFNAMYKYGCGGIQCFTVQCLIFIETRKWMPVTLIKSLLYWNVLLNHFLKIVFYYDTKLCTYMKSIILSSLDLLLKLCCSPCCVHSCFYLLFINGLHVIFVELFFSEFYIIIIII